MAESMILSTVPTDFLSLKLGESTVGENLLIARERGDIIQHEDGSWSLARPPLSANNWIFGTTPTPFPCGRLMGFLFNQAYNKAAVPVGCRDCYKVQVRPATLDQLMVTQRLAHALPYAYKAGASLSLRYQEGPYRALFYLDGLAQAREVYRQVRERVDSAPGLGPDVEVTIKRGCTTYEIHCGPSDGFTFSDDLQAAENALLMHLRPVKSPAPQSVAITLTNWVQIAYQVGDESYRHFTHGRPLYPAPVTYPPA